MISASPTRSLRRLRVSAVLVAAARRARRGGAPRRRRRLGARLHLPPRAGAVLPVARGAAAVAAAQPLSPRALGVGPRRDRGNFANVQPDGYPAVRGSYTLRRSLATFHGTWSFSTGYSGLSTVEVAGTIDFSRRQPVLRIAYSAGQTLAAVLNCNDLSCTRYGSLDVQGVQGHRAPAQGLKSRRARPGVGAAVAPPRSRPLPARASGAARRLLPHRREGERTADGGGALAVPLSRGGVLGNGRPATSGQDGSSARLARGARRGFPGDSGVVRDPCAGRRVERRSCPLWRGSEPDVRRPGPREVVRNTRDRIRRTRAPEDDDPPLGPPPPPVPVERATARPRAPYPGRAPLRSARGQIPCLPGDRMPLGSSASLIVSLKRRYAWSLKPYWSAARSMKSRCARYSP